MEPNRKNTPGWRVAVLSLCLFQAPAGGLSTSLPDEVQPCVPCHHRSGSDPVGEWLASPYSEIEGGRGCTDCHGPSCSREPLRTETALERASFRRNAVGLSLRADCSGDDLTAEVAVSNIGVGHVFPTASDRRTLVLEIIASDRNGAPLPGRTGSRAATGGSFIVQRPLAPFATAVARFHFAAPAFGPASVSAQLLLVPDGASQEAIAEAQTTCKTAGNVR